MNAASMVEVVILSQQQKSEIALQTQENIKITAWWLVYDRISWDLWLVRISPFSKIKFDTTEYFSYLVTI